MQHTIINKVEDSTIIIAIGVMLARPMASVDSRHVENSLSDSREHARNRILHTSLPLRLFQSSRIQPMTPLIFLYSPYLSRKVEMEDPDLAQAADRPGFQLGSVSRVILSCFSISRLRLRSSLALIFSKRCFSSNNRRAFCFSESRSSGTLGV